MVNASWCVAQTTKAALLIGSRLKASGSRMALKLNFYFPFSTPQEHRVGSSFLLSLPGQQEVTAMQWPPPEVVSEWREAVV